MKEKLLCVVTPEARTYYKAICLAKEFLDKDQNVINKTGTIPNGEVTELSATSVTVKHFLEEKLHGKLEVINLSDRSVTFSEEYNHGQLIHVSDHTLPPQPLPLQEEKSTPRYQGTVVKISKDVRAFYVEGKQIAEETLSSNGATLELLGNIPDGEVKEFTDAGKLKSEAYYQNNKLQGVLTRYDENGRVLSKETYEQGALQGKAEYFSYTKRGAIKTSCSYNNALLEGDLIVTQADGVTREQSTYSKGRLHGPRNTYYANGKIEVEETFIEGKLSGKRKLFFPTGELWYTENYINGRLDAERTEFFPNGKIHLQEFYSDGMLDGQRAIYDENGNLLTSEEYHWGNVMHNTEYRPK